ncbi:MAG: DUF1614 domain-containing protein, partial [Firmicutes bacterium]|nr:DUF1614 domain-containing protein [Bacillota bacterium]
MTIGLLCLGTVALLIFFGVAQKTLKEIGIPEWVAFVFVLALVIGVVMPSLQFGNVYLSISGFLLPLVCCALLFAVIGIKKELLSVLIATLAIAASTMIVKFLLPVSLNEFVSLQCLLIGLCGGLFACLFAKKRTAALLSSILGILLGDALVALIHMYAYHFVFVSIGSDGIFDAIVLSSLLGVVLVALVENMRVAQQQRRQTSKALLIEAAEDFDLQKKQEKKE